MATFRSMRRECSRVNFRRSTALACVAAALMAAGRGADCRLLADDFPPAAVFGLFQTDAQRAQIATGPERASGCPSQPVALRSPSEVCPIPPCWKTGREEPVVRLVSNDESPISSDVNAKAQAPDETDSARSRALEMCVDPPISIGDDLWCALPRLGHDSWGVVNNWNNLAILGLGLGGSLAIRSELDESVRNWTAEHPDRWGEGSKILGNFGVAQYQIPVLLTAYVYTVWADDADDHAMMASMISAYAITGLSVVTIKGIANTSRPSEQWNGGKFGFPSWHTASLFSIAAVLDDYEGHWVGMPVYALAGLVGWSRIDTRDHDLSDVVFGAVLGYVIGHSVSGRALDNDSRVHLLPYTHPTDGSPGVLIDCRF